jgi:lipoate-protein ligase A
MTETWDFFQSAAADAATNMAVDEALMRTAAGRGRSLLRVYAWEKPAASIGYFQRFPSHLTGRYDIVRRPTGGGLVYHGADTTYTVVAPAGHTLFEMAAAEAYRAIHKAVAAALDMESQILNSKSQTTRTGYDCFRNPVRGDVVADGRKLAGAAQRRSKWGLLHQGSVAAKLTADQLAEGFRDSLAVEFRHYELVADEREVAEKLANAKYATEAWNKRIA